MAEPLPKVVKQPGGPNEYLAYLTRPEMQHLRSNPAAPHDERLPDTGPLNTFNGVPLFWEMGGAPGADGPSSGGTGAGGDLGGGSVHGVGGLYGADNTGAQVGLSSGGWGGDIDGGGDGGARSEGGGEVIQAAKKGGVVKGNGVKNGVKNGGTNGGTDTPAGPTEAELLADRIEDAMGAIRGLFAGRQGVYDRLRDSSYDLSKSGIADAYGKASRKLRFQMLRQGLETGQPDIDLRADLSKLKNDSLADAMRHAQGLAEGLRSKDSAKRSGLMSQALTGQLTPGAIGGMSGTLSAGVPQAWGGISDIGWNIPAGYAPSGSGGFMPNWRSQDTGAYFGSSS